MISFTGNDVKIDTNIILFTVTHERFEVAFAETFTFSLAYLLLTKNFAALGSLWESSFGGSMYPRADISWKG